MGKKQFTFLLIIIYIVMMLNFMGPVTINASVNTITTKDMTSKLEYLGQPFTKLAYARNVWDMQVFNNRIYLGHGNNANYGPAPNAGPVPVIYYDTSINKFITQFSVDEEQIHEYDVINGVLTIPGNDARESWSYGNYYTLENDLWKKHRTIPQAVHVFSLADYKGKLYAVTDTAGLGEVLMSKDGGNTWTPQKPTNGTKFTTYALRAYTLLKLNGKLYVLGAFSTVSEGSNDVLVMDGTTITSQKININKFFSGAKEDYLYRIARWSVLGNKLAYIGANVNNSSQWSPFGLYISTDINQSSKVVLQEPTALPCDMLIRDGSMYLLAYMKNGNKYTNIVYTSKDLQNWTEQFRFNTDTFTRSFEELNGDFYFGLGCDSIAISDSTGKIYKLSKTSIASTNKISTTASVAITPTTISADSAEVIALAKSLAASPTAIMYSFNDLNGAMGPVKGVHGGIDFGSGKWSFFKNYIGFAKCGFSMTNSALTFTLPSQRVLKSIRVSVKKKATYTISSEGNPSVKGTITSISTPVTLITGWNKASANVTIEITGESYISDILYDNGNK